TSAWRHFSATWKTAVCFLLGASSAFSCSMIGSASMSRMILPMYWSWRRRASCFVNFCASRTASRGASGRSMRESFSGESFPSAARSACSSCMCRFRRVLLIKSSSSIALRFAALVPSVKQSEDRPTKLPDDHTPNTSLPLSRGAMADVARRALAIAKRLGASDAEIEVSAAVGQSVTVRRGEVETVEYNRDKGMGITVYFGRRRGNASTSALGLDGVEKTVEAACAIARHTAEDT